jgi:hypothetical protein
MWRQQRILARLWGEGEGGGGRGSVGLKMLCPKQIQIFKFFFKNSENLSLTGKPVLFEREHHFLSKRSLLLLKKSNLGTKQVL